MNEDASMIFQLVKEYAHLKLLQFSSIQSFEDGICK